MPASDAARTADSPRTSAARDRILQTAHDLFYRDGIRATGIDRVIAESGVTKVTFYRHFPSKNDLVRAFLDYRHEHWMTWFRDALDRHGNSARSLPAVLAEWFHSPGFRGCAFLNSVAELGGTLPDVNEVTLRHKEEVVAVLEALLPSGRNRHGDAVALCVAMDGTIVRATYEGRSDEALGALQRIVDTLAPNGEGVTGRTRTRSTPVRGKR